MVGKRCPKCNGKQGVCYTQIQGELVLPVCPHCLGTEIDFDSLGSKELIEELKILSGLAIRLKNFCMLIKLLAHKFKWPEECCHDALKQLNIGLIGVTMTAAKKINNIEPTSLAAQIINTINQRAA